MSNQAPQVVGISVNRDAGRCVDCRVGEMCVRQGLSGAELIELGGVIRNHRVLARGAHLYPFNHRMQAVFAVHTGSVKTYFLDDNNREHVCGFYYPGEVVGLDTFLSGYSRAAAKTLETTSICEISMESISLLGDKVPGFRKALLSLMSHEIQSHEEHAVLLSKKSAEERLARLLLYFSKRFRDRGFSPREFRLTMTRTDIGDYLALASETVSRIFTKFQHDELIKVNRKLVTIRNFQALAALAGEKAPAEPIGSTVFLHQ